MNRRLAKFMSISIVLLGGLTSGCTGGVFAEELREFLTATAKDTAVALGNFLVEQAVDAVSE